MKSAILAVALAFVVAPAFAADAVAPKAAEAKINTVCPFSGKAVDGKIVIEVKVGDKVTKVAVADKAAAEAALKTAKAEDVVAAAAANKKIEAPKAK